MIELSRRSLRIVANCRAASGKWAGSRRVVVQDNTGFIDTEKQWHSPSVLTHKVEDAVFRMNTAVFTMQSHRWPDAYQTSDPVFLFMGHEA